MLGKYLPWKYPLGLDVLFELLVCIMDGAEQHRAILACNNNQLRI